MPMLLKERLVDGVLVVIELRQLTEFNQGVPESVGEDADALDKGSTGNGARSLYRCSSDSGSICGQTITGDGVEHPSVEVNITDKIVVNHARGFHFLNNLNRDFNRDFHLMDFMEHLGLLVFSGLDVGLQTFELLVLGTGALRELGVEAILFVDQALERGDLLFVLLALDLTDVLLLFFSLLSVFGLCPGIAFLAQALLARLQRSVHNGCS